jgi:hypothetical protein
MGYEKHYHPFYSMVRTVVEALKTSNTPKISCKDISVLLEVSYPLADKIYRFLLKWKIVDLEGNVYPAAIERYLQWLKERGGAVE